MAHEVPNYQNGNCVAAADLRTKQYFAVKVTAAFTVGLCTVAGETVFGILTNKPNTGEVAAVTRIGLVPVISGAAVAAGAAIMTNASGKLITAATAGSRIIGYALEAAGAADQQITADVICHAAIV